MKYFVSYTKRIYGTDDFIDILGNCVITRSPITSEGDITAIEKQLRGIDTAFVRILNFQRLEEPNADQV